MISISVNARDLVQISAGKVTAAVKRALRKAGTTALRDMRSEASKRIRARKKIKARYIREALRLRRPKGSDVSRWAWAVDVSGRPVPLVAYPHRQTPRALTFEQRRRKRKPGGVWVQVNQGKRTLIRGAFLATMKSGHKGVWVRRGAKRLPIRELLGSRPVDALLHKGEAEAVLRRGHSAFSATFTRVLPLELARQEKQ